MKRNKMKRNMINTKNNREERQLEPTKVVRSPSAIILLKRVEKLKYIQF